MVARSFLALLGLVVLGVGTGAAQLPSPQNLPDRSKAPLLYVRFPGPPGMRVTVYPGASTLRDFTAPVTLGFRPGYIYRVRLSNLPERPNISLVPTLEVHGSLQLSAPSNPVNYPAVVVVNPDDVQQVLEGALLTKVHYLEDPQRALAERAQKDQPFEIELPPSRDLMQEARALGRPMLLVRFGNRIFTDTELAREGMPGTILLPGQKALSPPPLPPYLPLITAKFVDPLAGAKPLSEECLHDGGDHGPRAGFDRNGQIQGVDPEDTVAEYRNSIGQRKIAVSNRVCVCVPRFAVLRHACVLGHSQASTRVTDTQHVQSFSRLQAQVPPLSTSQSETVAATQSRERPSGTENQIGLSVVEQRMGLGYTQGKQLTTDVTATCREEPRTVDRPLQLTKWTDCKETHLGDVVTFYIRYSNVGGRPINDVAISDSLTGRLEYVAGSSESSRPSNFTTQPNESGSVLLRWEIQGALQPGESGTVRFQARVR